MSFVTFSYLALLFTVFLIRIALRNSSCRDVYLWVLLAVSLIFYASYIPRYLFLLIGITLIDYWVGGRIWRTSDRRLRLLWLTLSIVSNLGLLAFYKYTQFFIDTIKVVSYLFDHPVLAHAQVEWALPLGISFFTFESMSYTIDIYRGVIRPERKYWRFLLFVSFFTHLVSGPIVRARELLYQFDRKRGVWPGVLSEGLYLIVRGFFLKRVVADNLADYVNNYWRDDHVVNGSASFDLLLIFFFGCQIFADFEGYTSIARGSAYLLGFRLPNNFNYPYIAGSFKGFWQRWHITLSTWIRDYLYIPLGGNRVGEWRIYFNLLLVMTVAGLWHGAAWTFVIWGFIHGTALVIERMIGLDRREKWPGWIRCGWFLVVQAVVLLAWVYFRSDSAEQAADMVQSVLSGKWGWEMSAPLVPGLIFTIPVLAMHAGGSLAEKGLWKVTDPWGKAILAALMVYAVLAISGKNNAFIYFHF